MSSQEYPVDDEFPQGYILGSTLFLLHFNDLPDDAICDMMILLSILSYNLCLTIYVRRVRT